MNSLAIITGASRGIGLATASRFLSAGWTVLNFSRTPCPLKKVNNYVCDLSNAGETEHTLKQLDVALYSRISVVHNAAAFPTDNVDSLTETAFLDILRINVVVPQIINRTLVSSMRAGSSIIFVGSTLSEIGVPDRLSYVTSKHALAGLMRGTCQDLGEKQIHTCLVCPGYTDTQMLRSALGSDSDRINQIEQSVLLGRLIAPEEIAELIFFCSNNPVINGAVLHANLGQK